mmetsp:Transcript_9384/g.13283  ORF Transcript_9384/g.13283 Transcript_9384/m.13283 type:complete len:130 (-) Transcript_9384:94-483(-)
MPGVSSCDEAHPAPPFKRLPEWGQSASNPSQTPRQFLSLHSGSLPTVSDACATIGIALTPTIDEIVLERNSRRDLALSFCVPVPNDETHLMKQARRVISRTKPFTIMTFGYSLAKNGWIYSSPAILYER